MVAMRSLLVLATVLGAVGAFTPHSLGSSRASPRSAEQITSTGWDSFYGLSSRSQTNLPSGEEQRKYRRTVYTHDDWRKHRSQDRFVYYLQAIFKSGVYKNLTREVTITTLIAILVTAYNCAVGGYTDFLGAEHGALLTSDFLPKIGLPLAAFTITSPSLGLLLGTSVAVTDDGCDRVLI